jgi:nucleoside-diphosphate-sugar epimerase
MSAFAGKKILVTGGSGFLGVPVISRLLGREIGRAHV